MMMMMMMMMMSFIYLGEIQEEKLVKHQFTEPWDYSDLILVVENEKFHVHRALLSMNSPVFKAMFQSQFKEATSSEIPLPEKKANEVLDFLKQIYFPYVKERVEITSKFENIFHSWVKYHSLIYTQCILFIYVSFIYVQYRRIPKITAPRK